MPIILTELIDCVAPKEPVTAFKINGDVLHIAFHPSGRQFAVVCPRSSRDEVFFYHLTYRDAKDVWEVRSDVGMGGPAVDIGFEEVCYTSWM